MENIVFIKAFSYTVLILLIIVAIGLVIWQLRKAGGSLSDALNRTMDNLFGPSTVTTPKSVQDFINQPSNNGYVPWTPEIVDEEDESFPPAWLTKGTK